MKRERSRGDEAGDTQLAGSDAVVVTERAAFLTRDHRLQITRTSVALIIIIIVQLHPDEAAPDARITRPHRGGFFPDSRGSSRVSGRRLRVGAGVVVDGIDRSGRVGRRRRQPAVQRAHETRHRRQRAARRRRVGRRVSTQDGRRSTARRRMIQRTSARRSHRRRHLGRGRRRGRSSHTRCSRGRSRRRGHRTRVLVDDRIIAWWIRLGGGAVNAAEESVRQLAARRRHSLELERERSVRRCRWPLTAARRSRGGRSRGRRVRRLLGRLSARVHRAGWVLLRDSRQPRSRFCLLQLRLDGRRRTYDGAGGSRRLRSAVIHIPADTVRRRLGCD